MGFPNGNICMAINSIRFYKNIGKLDHKVNSLSNDMTVVTYNILKMMKVCKVINSTLLGHGVAREASGHNAHGPIVFHIHEEEDDVECVTMLCVLLSPIAPIPIPIEETTFMD